MMISLSESRRISRRRDAKIISHAYARRGMNITERGALSRESARRVFNNRSIFACVSLAIVNCGSAERHCFKYLLGDPSSLSFRDNEDIRTFVFIRSFVRALADGQLRRWQ